MRTFRVLALVTAVAVYLQVVLGSVVRITGSGMGCRDWPTCYQHETDRFAYRTLLEIAHRLLGTAGGLLVVATALTAFVLYRRARAGGGFPRGLWVTSALGLGFYGFQGVLGGVTVLLRNQPITVAIHLANAEVVLGLLVVVALWAWTAAETPAQADARPLLPGVLAMAGAYAILITGAVVVGTGASGACTSWPLCGQAGSLADTHMLHRGVVLLGSGLILYGAAKAVGHRPREMTVAALTVGLLLGEAAVGAAQVLLALPPALRSLHVALASAVWSGTVLLAAAAWLDRRGQQAGARAVSHTRLSAVEAGS